MEDSAYVSDNVIVKTGGGNSYDILKFSMALLIVAIHTDAFRGPWFCDWAIPILNIAVPVFFILSSMFFFAKLREGKSEMIQLKHFISRIATLYFFWFVLNLPFIIFANKQYFIQGGFPDILRLVKDILLGETYFGSWFLTALVISVTIVTICHKKKLTSIILLIALLSFIYTSYNFYMPEQYQMLKFWWVRNISESMYLSFFEGLPWVSIGYLFSSDKIQRFIKECKGSSLLVMWIIFALVFFSYLFNSNYGISSINRIFLLLISTLLVLITGASKISPNIVYLYLRKASILFFFSHFIFIQILVHIFGSVREYIGNIGWYLVVLVCCSLFAIAVLLLKDKKGFGWLKYSY